MFWPAALSGTFSLRGHSPRCDMSPVRPVLNRPGSGLVLAFRDVRFSVFSPFRFSFRLGRSSRPLSYQYICFSVCFSCLIYACFIVRKKIRPVAFLPTGRKVLIRIFPRHLSQSRRTRQVPVICFCHRNVLFTFKPGAVGASCCFI